LAYQKAQSQTPSFHPASGGVIAAYERFLDQNVWVGGGASYLYTHISQGSNAGHSHINQESLFAYASYQGVKAYIDAAVWGGLFQTDQVRNIHMTGFNFKASSSPKGWQFLSHLELGWTFDKEQHSPPIRVNPFIMVDWVNAWQESYQEQGSSPFNTGQPAHYSSLLRLETGCNVSQLIHLPSGNLIFQEKASYVNVQSFSAGTVTAFLVGSPGSFIVETLGAPQNLGVALFRMRYEPRNSRCPSSTLFYQGEFGSKYQSHQLNVGMDWNF
jgi:outer membrane autotransporter protein